jgi:glycosyltransferase involved in cell wall biosynthesis
VISVIIPVFNRATTISRALDSLLAQTYRPLEIIVIDDGSSDGSGEVVRAWWARHACDGITLELYSTTNRGASAARNFGISKAKGRYLQFLDSDDYLSKSKLEVQVNALRISDASVAVCDFEILNELQNRKEVRRNNGLLLWRLAFGWSVSSSTPLIERDVMLGQVKVSWLETLHSRQDMDFMFKVFLLARKHVYTPGVMFSYIKHGSPQISDGYGGGASQYREEIRSIMHFWRRTGFRIPFRNWIFVVLRIGQIGTRGARFELRKYFGLLQ